MAEGKTNKTRYFTIIELIIVVLISLIVLLPMTAMMFSIARNWQTSNEVRQLQEELDLAAYSIKGLIEEASSFEIEDTESQSRIELNRADWAETKIIKENDGKLSIGHMDNVIDSLTGLRFEDKGNATVLVTIDAERAGREGKREFHVRLRN